MKIGFLVSKFPPVKRDLTTYDIAFAASSLGHEVYFLTLKSFSSKNSRINALTNKLPPMDLENRKQLLKVLPTLPRRRRSMQTLDALLLRHKSSGLNNVSHRTAREYAFHLKERGVFVMNDPLYLWFLSSKLSYLAFPQSIFPGKQLVSDNFDELYEFCRGELNYGGIIKPLNGSGGRGFFFADEKNLRSSLSTLLEKGAVVAQDYIPNEGDKRILLLGGEPISWYMRVSKDGPHNIQAGARPVRCDLTERDLEICEMIKDVLNKYGLHLVGLDVLGGYVGEINCENPGGTIRADKLIGTNSAQKIIKYIEKHIRK